MVESAYHLRTNYLVPSAWCQVFGTKNLVPSTRYQVLGTKYLVPSTWYQVPGTKYLLPSTCYQVPGTKYLVPSIWYQFWHLFILFQTPNLLPKVPYQWSGALNQCYLRRISMRIFSMLSKNMIFMICMIFWFLGPRPLGSMGPFIFRVFLKIYFMVWDLSRSVPRVFRSPGNPLIKFVDFKCN